MFPIIPVVTSHDVTTPIHCPTFGASPQSKAPNPLRRQPPLWTLIVVQLDARQFDFTLDDIAPLLGVQSHALRHHCRTLWPDNTGQWKLDFDQAAVLICHTCTNGIKLPNAQQLWRELSSANIITPGFPDNNPVVKRAELAISQYRALKARAKRCVHEVD